MKNRPARIIFNEISVVLSLCLCFCLFSPFLTRLPEASEAKELNLPEFDALQGTKTSRLYDQISDLKKSLDLTAGQMVRNLADLSSRQADHRIDFYLRNHTSSDLILTDMITHLDKELTHYNFSLEDSGIFYRNTIKKFAIPNVPYGKHEFRLSFLFYPVSSDSPGSSSPGNSSIGTSNIGTSSPGSPGSGSREEKVKAEKRGATPPLKGCSFLSDAHCLHKNPVTDIRVVKKISFHFSCLKDRPLVTFISFDDSNTPQLMDTQIAAIQKLQMDVETVKGIFLNRDYLVCLWRLNALLRDSASLKESDSGGQGSEPLWQQAQGLAPTDVPEASKASMAPAASTPLMTHKASIPHGSPGPVSFKALLTEILFLKAKCFFHLEMYSEAIQAYQQLQEEFPHSDYHHLSMFGIEMAHYLSGQHSLTIAVFQQFGTQTEQPAPVAAEILGPARYIAAKSYYREKQLAQSAHLLELIPQKSPYYLFAQYLLAFCYLTAHQQGRVNDAGHNSNDNAIKALENITHLPSPANYHYLTSPFKVEGLGTMDEMRLVLGPELDTDHLIQSAHLLLGKLWYQQEEYEKSLEEFEAIPATSPYYLSGLTGKGLIFLQLHNEEKVREILDEFSKKSLENRFLSDARFMIADNRQQMGKPNEAYAVYQESIERCQTAISVIEQLQKDQDKFENLILFSIDAHYSSDFGEAKPHPALSPLTSYLYNPVRDLLKSKKTMSCWNALLEGEKTIQSMKDLLIAPESAYPEKVQVLSRLMRQPKDRGEGSSPLVNRPAQPDQTELDKVRQAAYEHILDQGKKIKEIKNDVISLLKDDVHESLTLISSRLSEIQDRANLEIGLAKYRGNFPSPTAEDPKSLDALGRVIMAHESFVEKYPQSPYLEKILFQLAECSYLKSSLDFQQQLKNVEKKKGPADFLLESRPTFDMAIKLYERILSQFPQGQYTEKSLYALAYTYQEQGAVILAKSLFQRLIHDYPDSSLALEVLVRLGEISFDENKFAQAAEYYGAAADSGKLPKQYRNSVLYKLAWSSYKQNQDRQAFNLFVSLADEYAAAQNFFLLGEMTAQLAKMGSEYDSLEQAKTLLSPLEGKSYYFQVLKRMADLLFDQEKSEDAIGAYQWAIKSYPLAKDDPVFQSRIEQCYLKLNNPKAANKARESLVTTYGENTHWWKENRDEAIRKQVSLLIDESIRNTTQYLLESKNEKDYQDMIKFCRKNLSLFPSAEQVYTISFFLAECLYKTNQYGQALPEYERVVQDKEFHKFAEDAAYKQTLCLEKIIEQKSSSITKAEDKTAGKTKQSKAEKDRVEKGKSGGKAEEWGPEEKKFLAACDYLLQYFPRHEHLPEILYKKGELYLQKGQAQDTIGIFEYIIEHFQKSEIRTSALKMLAKARFSQEKFDLAAKVYSEIVSDCDQKMKSKENTEIVLTRKNAFKMMALSSYKEAELLLKGGKPLEAAKKFEATANDFPKEQTADMALFGAARIYQAHDQPKKAYQTFALVLLQYPGSEYAPQSLLQVALEQEKNKQIPEAAQSYEKLYIDYPKFSESPKALYKAGRLYEEVESWSKVIKVFSLYQTELRPEPSLALEVNFRRGYALMKNGEVDLAEAAFQVVLDTYERYKAQDSALSPYYPAWAQFLIGEMVFSAYDRVKFQEYSDQAMQPKLDLLKKVLEKYTKAAEFKIAEWTTPAYFSMGLAVDKLAWELQEKSQSRSASQSGGNDPASLLNVIQMQEKIIEFKEKARLFYQKNINLSEKNKIHKDPWIARSRKSLTKNYWQTGQVYETIYSLIKGAPIPEVLDEEQAKSYSQALMEKALPYQNQAVEMYTKNTEAFSHKIEYNSFIGQSYQRLAILKPERYLREEQKPLYEDQSGLNLPDQLLLRE